MAKPFPHRPTIGRFGNFALGQYRHGSKRNPDQNSQDPEAALDSDLFGLFARPAFTTRFSKEDKEEDFLEAIKDTMTAINTGQLYSRREKRKRKATSKIRWYAI
jgi:hypothetical protein